MRYYIVAGERSGDLHGGNLIRAIRKRDAAAEIRGFGGEYMKQAGMDLAVHYGDLAIMGMVELLTSAVKISGYIRSCKRDILQFKPDVIILIDYGGFNLQIAKFGKKQDIKVFYYIPPKVWAWYQQRALQLKARVSRLFVILPFEKEFYKKFDWDVDYVGNPVMDAVKSHTPVHDFLSKTGLSSDKPVVALLPGSRKQELLTIIPVMAAVVRNNPRYQYAVALVDNLDESLYEPLKNLNVKFVRDSTYDLLRHATAAIVTSGTATLETALFRVPQVVVYKTNPISYFLAKKLVSISFISLVNLIAGREVVKELIQQDANEAAISEELEAIVQGDSRSRMLDGYDEIIKRLDAGGSASENAASLMVDDLRHTAAATKR